MFLFVDVFGEKIFTEYAQVVTVFEADPITLASRIICRVSATMIKNCYFFHGRTLSLTFYDEVYAHARRQPKQSKEGKEKERNL